MAKAKKAAPATKPTDTHSQAERFKRFAEEHGATEDVLDKAMGDKAKRLRTEPKPKS